MRKNKVRPLALCLFERDGDLLLQRIEDDVKGVVGYRPVGGGIEFGETSRQTVIREVREELKAEITDLALLGVFENIFTFRGNRGHEIIILYRARFTDPRLYRGAGLTAFEDDDAFDTVWAPLRDFVAGREILYPTGLLETLTGKSSPTRLA